MDNQWAMNGCATVSGQRMDSEWTTKWTINWQGMDNEGTTNGQSMDGEWTMNLQ